MENKVFMEIYLTDIFPSSRLRKTNPTNLVGYQKRGE